MSNNVQSSEKDIELEASSNLGAAQINNSQSSNSNSSNTEAKANDVEVGNNSEKESLDFRLSTIMIPWHFDIFIKQFFINMFPYFHIIFAPQTPELKAGFWLASYNWNSPGFWQTLTNHRYALAFVLIFVLSGIIYGNEDARNEKYSDNYVPVLQVICGVFVGPLLCVVCHRFSIANKYACLSRQEYASYVQPKPADKQWSQMIGLNLLGGWQHAFPDVMNFEINAASARSGVDCLNACFYVADPLLDLESYNNFRLWQAFLLGKHTLEGLSHELHPDLQKVLIRSNSVEADPLNIALSKFQGKDIIHKNDEADDEQAWAQEGQLTPQQIEFRTALEKEKRDKALAAAEAVGPTVSSVKSVKAKFKLLAKKETAVAETASKIKVGVRLHYKVSIQDVARAMFRKVQSIPQPAYESLNTYVYYGSFLSVAPFFIPVVFRPMNPAIPLYVRILVIVVLCLAAYVGSFFWWATINIIIANSADSTKRKMTALLLKEMIRLGDLDFDNDVVNTGSSVSQRTPVPDIIERKMGENGKLHLHFKSGRNPDIARMPRIYTNQGGRNNFLSWNLLRTLSRNYGARFKWWLGAFANFIFAAIFFSEILMLIIFLIEIKYASDPLNPVISPALRIPLFHTLGIQIVYTVVWFTTLTLIYTIASANANLEYSLHTKVLLNRLMKNESERCFLADHADNANSEMVASRLTYLQDISAAIDITIRNCKQCDSRTPITVFGSVASVNVITVLITYNGLWISIFSAIYASAQQYKELNTLFLNSDANR